MENKEKVIEETKEVMLGVDNRLLFRLTKPYTFEGKSYDSVDLSRLNELTLTDMVSVERRVRGAYVGGDSNPLIEMTLIYACHLAATAANLPVEFFLGLPITDSMTLKGIVTGFLF